MNPPADRILTLLQQLYPADQATSTYSRIMEMLSQFSPPHLRVDEYFSERNITLITYGDSLQSSDKVPLETLYNFLNNELKQIISTVHILPFYPYSSDDGFSVIDYYAINPQLGTWRNIERIGHDFRLMFDAVINHMSAESDWFKQFLADNPAYDQLFRVENPTIDLKSVTRPRTSPLLTAFQKSDRSTVYIWTTFSADQVDLDYRDPDTLLRIFQVLLFYVEKGAEVLRLDAIAYLWKEIGTRCIHLPQTHAVIQLMRAMLDVVAPAVVLITETNVPHTENIAYFGSLAYPEAQLVYNFTLPPLLFYTFQAGDARKLSDWVNTLHAPRPETAFFNFTASHDGIGVRPLEGLLNAKEMQSLIQKVEQSGGQVSYKANSDGTRSPYELNITYVDAITNPSDSPDLQASHFLVSQAIMLALAGIPAIYIHSLLGSRNDIQGMEQSDYPRAINRKKLVLDEVMSELRDEHSFRSKVFGGYKHLIQIRTKSAAFHPKAGQRAFSLNQGKVFALERVSIDYKDKILCLFNITGQQQALDTGLDSSTDLLTGEHCTGEITLNPYQVRWLQHKAAQ